ncbi:MAG: HD domain-containing phosphohydrolase [Candidatus Thiodiazotropha sp. (ex. Lucinoma kazani)]
MDSLTQPDPYIKHVTTLGDMQQIVSTEDILNDEGVSLVKQGTRIDSSLYERLVRHKLLRPLDNSLSVENAVTPLSLLTDAKRLLASEPELERAIDESFIQRDILTPLVTIHLEPQMAFKLTVCREQSIDRYHHMLRVALVALYIAAQLRWSSDERHILATAGVFHDLGEMHLEPSLFDRSKPLTLAQRRQIYSHPTIAYLFLREFPAYHPRISFAVHQHHERLDGSGYPKGLIGDDVMSVARLLGAAELLTVIRLEQKNSGNGLFSTAEVLKFNAERFGCEIILPLIEAAKRIDKATGPTSQNGITNKTALQARMKLLIEILQGAKGIDVEGDGEMAAFISNQLEGVEGMAKRCGVDLNAPANLLAIIGDDDQAVSELNALVREMIFLVQSTAREALRRWVKDEIPEQDQEPLTKWLRNAELALHSAGFQSQGVTETL